MTMTADRTTPVVDEVDAGVLPEPEPEVRRSLRDPEPPPPEQRLGTGPLVALWFVVALVVIGIVLYAIEPLFQQREQGLQLERYRVAIEKSANQATGLRGVEVPTTAPELGTAVGIVEIGSIGLRQVVLEGAAAGITQKGPGHVPGTSAPGQPGNSVIVGRRAMFGGPFGELERLKVGDQIVITTTQGQSLYEITEAGTARLTAQKEPTTAPEVAKPTPVSTTTTTIDPASTTTVAPDVTTTTTVAETTTTVVADESTSTTVAATSTSLAPGSVLDGGAIGLDSLYGASSDDRLTLVSSASAFPWNSAEATVVIAVMKGKPFEPTPQNGRSVTQTGNRGSTSQWPTAVLAILCLGVAIAGAVVLYRRSSPRIAYLLTVPPMLAFAILASESLSLLLPAWS